ncbi:hypothetical protein A8926_3072 [Saccharopolyspora spinosa]|uniref:Uncharacterized protein n=1 Tax=Saccharopolyspora spinosa TaxID=60894 RepID=A0A2N3XXH5_SACSN|nr:hypothetical protein A8926_3072 [Saccharopolyspora spinosa]
MRVDGRVPAPEQLVLVPAGFPYVQRITGCFRVRDVRGFVGRVGDRQNDVEDRLGRETGHRSRPRVPGADDQRAERRADALLFARVLPHPGRVGLSERDRTVDAVVRLEALGLRIVGHGPSIRRASSSEPAHDRSPAACAINFLITPHLDYHGER